MTASDIARKARLKSKPTTEEGPEEAAQVELPRPRSRTGAA
jgi:hypothetical protein